MSLPPEERTEKNEAITQAISSSLNTTSSQQISLWSILMLLPPALAVVVVGKIVEVVVSGFF